MSRKKHRHNASSLIISHQSCIRHNVVGAAFLPRSNCGFQQSFVSLGYREPGGTGVPPAGVTDASQTTPPKMISSCTVSARGNAPDGIREPDRFAVGTAEAVVRTAVVRTAVVALAEPAVEPATPAERPAR